MNDLFKALFVFGISFGVEVAVAQPTQVSIKKFLSYKQQVDPVGMDCHNYSVIYSNAKKVYNLGGFQLSKSTGLIQDLKVNPAGASYTTLSSTKKRNYVEVFDMYESSHLLWSLPQEVNPTAICYTADSEYLVIASQGKVAFYDTRSYTKTAEVTVEGTPTKLCASANGFYVAAAVGNKVLVVNQKSKNVRQTLNFNAEVVAFDFSKDSEFLGVATGDDKVAAFSTQSLAEIYSNENLGHITALTFHPESKYMVVSADHSKMSFLNLRNKKDVSTITDDGDLSNILFVTDNENHYYLVHNADDEVRYKQIAGLTPNYTKFMEGELNNRLAEWSKMQPMETEEAYKQRVTPEKMAQQKRLFANEIVTDLAGDLLSEVEVSLGQYNTETNMLALEMGDMPDVYLDVPVDDVQDFKSSDDLEFTDVIYGLDENDNFKVIYAHIHNKKNGKTYVFDNKEEKSLDYLKTSDKFVPLETVQTASKEEVALKDIKNDVVAAAQLSENTNINVSTRVESGVNAKGERVENYKVDFNYSVNAEFSEADDFAPGAYRIEKSQAAQSMMKIISKAFNDKFAKYMGAGKEVVVTITGSADAMPIRRGIPYDGSYGTFKNEPCTVNGKLDNISVSEASGIKTNEQLAFLRAVGVKKQLQKEVSSLDKMDVNYKYKVNISKSRGGEYRRIHVNFMFVDAF